MGVGGGVYNLMETRLKRRREECWFGSRALFVIKMEQVSGSVDRNEDMMADTRQAARRDSRFVVDNERASRFGT